VNIFGEAIAYILDPANLLGAKGILPRLGDHLYYSGLAVGIALIIGLPLGLLVGHTGRGRSAVIAFSGAARALPTLGLLFFIILFTGLGLWPLVAVLVLLAVPPIVAGAYSGLESVNRQTIDAARSIGMTEWQILWRVEIPLALPLIVGGIRSAVLQVIATATIAGYVGLTGLGRFLIEGLAVRNYALAITGAILVAVLAVVVDALLALSQKLVTPRGVSRGVTGYKAPLFRRSLRASGTPS
jgi:osmoprotectant transport system permease protein